MKILYVTTIGGTMSFFTNLIKKLISEGHTIDIATNEEYSPVSVFYRELGCRVFQMPWSRSPFDKGNIKAIGILRKLVAAGEYDIVHCHTPIAAVCTRIACRSLRKKGLQVIYTAHGFHFYKGAPIKNWLLYYPMEKLCAHWTDVLITINTEDYDLAKRKMKAKRVEYIPGVGIDTGKFSPDSVSNEEKLELRRTLGVNGSTKMFLSVGELSVRKNHEVVLEALSKWTNTDYRYFIVGVGDLKKHLEEKIIEYGLSDRVVFLGYRNDVAKLCSIADLFIFPSLQEGLPVALMEAIASKLTVICSKIRGSEELVTDKNMFSATNSNELLSKIIEFDSGELIDSIEINYNTLKRYDLSVVMQEMQKLYGGGTAT